MNLCAKVLFLAVLGLGSQTLYTGAQTTAPAPATTARLPVMSPAPAAPPGTVLDVHFAPLPPQPTYPGVATYRTTVPGPGPTVLQYNPLTVTGTSYAAQSGYANVSGQGTVYLAQVDSQDAEAARLSRQLADAKTDADKDKLKDKIKELLVKQFDERQKRHEKELEALEAQVKKLKEMVNKRQDNKREIIDERMKQLQRDAQGLGW